MRTLAVLFFACLLCATTATAAWYYVDVNSATPVSPYTDWSTAATNIQDATSLAQPGDLVFVTNGVYKYGGAVLTQSGNATNRVVVPRSVTVMSVNGAADTIIVGQSSAGGKMTRCAFVSSNAVLSGFTLTNGYSGGAYCDPNGIVSNCIIVGCQGSQGGGVHLGKVYNSLIVSNSATFGGGAFNAALFSCTLRNNYAPYAAGPSGGGGGAYGCTLYNCLVVSNSSYYSGGGAAWSTVYNCTVVVNTCTNSGQGLSSGTAYNSIIWSNSAFTGTFLRCCMPSIIVMGDLTVTNDPGFENWASGDYHLKSDSACINAGGNSYAAGATDFDGNPRIVGGTVDIGAYEYQSPTSLISYAWLRQYGFPIDGSADFLDPDHDGMNNWQEWIAATNPTNSGSVLRIVSVTNGPSGTAVSWRGDGTRSYFLQRASDLGAQPVYTTIVTNLAGQGANTTFTDTNATGAGPFFYRVGVQR